MVCSIEEAFRGGGLDWAGLGPPLADATLEGPGGNDHRTCAPFPRPSLCDRAQYCTSVLLAAREIVWHLRHGIFSSVPRPHSMVVVELLKVSTMLLLWEDSLRPARILMCASRDHKKMSE